MQQGNVSMAVVFRAMSPIWFLVFLLTPQALSIKFSDVQTEIIDKLKYLKKYVEEENEKAHADEEIIKSLKYHKVPDVIDAQFIFEKKLYCQTCPLLFSVLIYGRRHDPTFEFELTMEFVCQRIIGYSGRVCKSYVVPLLDFLLYLIDQTPDLESSTICNLVFQSYDCSYGEDYNLSVKIPAGNSVRRPKPLSNQTFTILHITDVHLDPLYTANGNGECSEVICCQKDQGPPSSPDLGCGCWGDYRKSDTPWNLMEETIKQTKNKPFDFVYFTGDIVPHSPWHININNNSDLFTKVKNFFKDNFDVPIYTVFGNHETSPLDYWAPPKADKKFQPDWLYHLAAKQFSEMSRKDVSEMVMKGGYYTLSPKPGFRVVALNNNVALVANHWLMYDQTNVQEQLQWLVDVLEEAEKKKEAVHIISHVPVGTTETIKAWDREYAKIIDRFAGTIAGQFNGHSHYDEFRVYYNSSNHSQPIGAAFNGASITPHGAKANPSFKYFTIASTTYDLIDYEEYTFNLTLANTKCNETPSWYKLYSFREAYGAKSLHPEEVDNVVHKMAKNHSLLNDYFRFYHRNGDPAIKNGCDERCRRNFLCQIVTVVYGSECHCQRFLAMYDKHN